MKAGQSLVYIVYIKRMFYPIETHIELLQHILPPFIWSLFWGHIQPVPLGAHYQKQDHKGIAIGIPDVSASEDPQEYNN